MLKLLIKVSRPIFWVLGPLIIASGIIYSGSGSSFNTLAIIQMILASFPLSFVCFGINDIYDYESDRINRRKNSINGAVLNPKYHKLVFNLSIILSAVLLLSSIFTGNIVNIVSMSVLLVLVYGYSMPPLRLKQRPVIDSLSNGMMVLLLFMTGFSYSKGVADMDIRIFLAALCVAGVHSYTTLVDYSTDKLVGDRTFAVVLGKRATTMFPLVIFLTTLFFGKFGEIVNTFLLFCMSLFFISAVFPSEKLAKFFSYIIFIGTVFTAIFYLSSLV